MSDPVNVFFYRKTRGPWLNLDDQGTLFTGNDE